MSREIRLYLLDIRLSTQRILEYTAGMSRADFFADQRTIDASVRNLEIIGEAAGRVPQGLSASLDEINFGRIRAMRNILAHAYFGIDEDILWDVITTHVPVLHQAVADYLDSPDHQPD